MTHVRVVKAQCSSFDAFLLRLDDPSPALSPSLLQATVELLCDRSGPYGASGVYAIEPHLSGSYVTFHSSSSSAELGARNGLRAVGRFIADALKQRDVTFRFEGASYNARVNTSTAPSPSVSVSLPSPIEYDADVRVPGVLDSPRIFTKIGFHPPHYVAPETECDPAMLSRAARALSRLPDLIAGSSATVAVRLPGHPDQLGVSTLNIENPRVEIPFSADAAVGASLVAFIDQRQSSSNYLIRMPGGPSEVRITSEPSGISVVESGNATYVYSTILDIEGGPDRVREAGYGLDAHLDEIMEFETAYHENLTVLKRTGLERP